MIAWIFILRLWASPFYWLIHFPFGPSFTESLRQYFVLAFSSQGYREDEDDEPQCLCFSLKVAEGM